MQEVGNVAEIVNAMDNNDGSFFFVPWIGNEYETGLLGKKVLIVGGANLVGVYIVKALEEKGKKSK